MEQIVLGIREHHEDRLVLQNYLSEGDDVGVRELPVDLERRRSAAGQHSLKLPTRKTQKKGTHGDLPDGTLRDACIRDDLAFLVGLEFLDGEELALLCLHVARPGRPRRIEGRR